MSLTLFTCYFMSTWRLWKRCITTTFESAQLEVDTLSDFWVCDTKVRLFDIHWRWFCSWISITCARGQGMGGTCTSRCARVIDRFAALPTAAWRSRCRVTQVSVRYWVSSYRWMGARAGEHSDSASLSKERSLDASKSGGEKTVVVDRCFLH